MAQSSVGKVLEQYKKQQKKPLYGTFPHMAFRSAKLMILIQYSTSGFKMKQNSGRFDKILFTLPQSNAILIVNFKNFISIFVYLA